MGSVIAVIPARKGSKRFPDKNLALLGGEPLVTWAIWAAKRTGVFVQIIVTSDDQRILDIAKAEGVRPFRRPDELCKDDVPVDKAVLHVMQSLRLRYDAVCLMTPTAPLRSPADVRGAIRLLFSTDAGFVCTVTEFDHSPWYALQESSGYLIPAFVEKFQERVHLTRLYRPVAVARVGQWDAVLEHGTLWGPKMLSYLIPRERGVDIDDSLDLEWAELLLKHESLPEVFQVPIAP